MGIVWSAWNIICCWFMTSVAYIYHPSNQTNNPHNKIHWCSYMTLHVDSFHTEGNMFCRIDPGDTLKILNIKKCLSRPKRFIVQFGKHLIVSMECLQFFTIQEKGKIGVALNIIFFYNILHTFTHVTFEAIFTIKTVSDLKVTIVV